MGMHDPLGPAGRAAGVRDGSDVLGLDIRCRQRPGGEGARQSENVGGVLAGAKGQQVPEARHTLLECAGKIAEISGIADQRLDLCILQHERMVVQ